MERPWIGAQLAILASKLSKARAQNKPSDCFNLQAFPVGASDFTEQRQAIPIVLSLNLSLIKRFSELLSFGVIGHEE